MDSMKLIQVRLPVSLVKQIDHMRIDRSLTRAALFETLLREAIACAALADEAVKEGQDG